MFITHPNKKAGSYNNRGLSILELILVVGLLALLATLLFTVLRPTEILSDARNRSREEDLNALINIVYRNISDNGGVFSCSSGSIPTSTTNMSDNNPSVGDYDIAPCLIPTYMSELPYDPSASGAQYTSPTDYDLQYSISQSTTTNRITITAPEAENDKSISITR